ncbi:MAG: anti-CBASS protein Acb1 family protein [Candidatus Thorarchaeota archaeon]|jgi:hypothetical protein
MSLPRRGFSVLRKFVYDIAGRSTPSIPTARTKVDVPGGAFVMEGDGWRRGVDSFQPGASGSRIPTTFSRGRPFGGDSIPDTELDFLVKREPVIHWTVWYVAQDIFDNKFRVFINDKPEDDTFDEAVQQALLELDAYHVLARSTAFERLYGTSIIVCSYRGSPEWTESIFEANGTLKAGLELVQITPYPKSQITVTETDSDDSSLRFGRPLFYEISRSDGSQFKVHWSKVIHDSPRIFDDPIWGMSVVQILYDDATGFRNMRWGLYQTIFRYGSGFPHIHLPWANRKQINSLIDSGEFDYINARGFFVTGGKEENKETLDFKGVQNVTLNPDPYVKVAFESFSLGSRIPQDIFKGVSAGRITGSEFNERNYYKYISSEQNSKTSVVRELIDRLLATGQVEAEDGRVRIPVDVEYTVFWTSAFELNEVDQTRISLWKSTTYKNYGAFMMVDEIRALEKLDPLPDGKGEVVIELLRLESPQIRPGQTQPEGGEPQGNRAEER